MGQIKNIKLHIVTDIKIKYNMYLVEDQEEDPRLTHPTILKKRKSYPWIPSDSSNIEANSQQFIDSERRRSSCPDLPAISLDNKTRTNSRKEYSLGENILPPIKRTMVKRSKVKSSKYGPSSSKYGQHKGDDLAPLMERSFVLHEDLPPLKVDASLYFLRVMKDLYIHDIA